MRGSRTTASAEQAEGQAMLTGMPRLAASRALRGAGPTRAGAASGRRRNRAASAERFAEAAAAAADPALIAIGCESPPGLPEACVVSTATRAPATPAAALAGTASVAVWPAW
ncbi:MAG: hypothetical protein ACJ76G_08810 [Solirubrobacterales bacterium]